MMTGNKRIWHAGLIENGLLQDPMVQHKTSSTFHDFKFSKMNHGHFEIGSANANVIEKVLFHVGNVDVRLIGKLVIFQEFMN